MPRNEDIQHSVLIISGSEQFTAVAKGCLPARRYISMENRTSAAAARRCILERDFDLVLIYAPLSDENGVSLALDIAENRHASIMLVVPSEIYDDVLERVTEQGILAIARPTTRTRIQVAIRFLFSIQDKMYGLIRETSAAREKAEEIRIIDKAKFVLMEQKKMTEDEAHRYIGKLAMNNGISRRRAAGMILDEYD